MTAVFTWGVDGKTNGSSKFSVLATQFGDGYKQTAANGINNKSQSWPVSFTGYPAKISAIKTFLDARAGFASFLWTPPNGVQGYYRCEGYDEQHQGGTLWRLTCTFEQGFQP
jgi:phage-related protein